MNFKLVASQQAGKYARGAEISDPAEIEKILSGNLAKRFVKRRLHPGEEADASAEEPVTESDSAAGA